MEDLLTHRKLLRMAEPAGETACNANCSGHGECRDGFCYCMIRYEGDECKHINFSYHVAFASIFYLLALTSLIQLGMCIHAEYLRMKKNPSILKACRITTQKFLYFLVFLASILRGTYFAAPTVGSEVSTSLLSAYYPVVLTSASLIVCFWAEVFHLREVRWDRPRFLSKSFLGFLAFNVISYSLLLAEMLLVWSEADTERAFYAHIFNGCYAVLMFVVVIFFLIYGVEVFFKVRGGFTVPRVSHVIAGKAVENERRSQRRRRRQDRRDQELKDAQPKNEHEDQELIATNVVNIEPKNQEENGQSTQPGSSQNNNLGDEVQNLNTSQLHQSRFGLLSQAVMMIITVGFMFSETLEQFWKTKVDLTSRNTHDIIFRTIEIGVALWFPCVLWNCIRPEQLWCLNPKKILDRRFKFKKSTDKIIKDDAREMTPETTTDEDDDKGPECWICYDPDKTDAGPMIRPCDCRGDVSAVHHDCLRRWLVESADNPDALKCKVCSADYQVEKGSQFSLANGFTTKQWLQTASLVTIICLAIGGAWAVIQLYYEPWIRILAVGGACFILYVCLRFLGLNTLTAYQRAKVSALKIVNLRIRGNAPVPVQDLGSISTVQVEFQRTRESTVSVTLAQTRL